MKKLMTILVFVFSMALLAGCGSTVVATVNGEEITQEQLDNKIKEVKSLYENQGLSFEGEQGAQLMENLKKQTLEDMINDKLLKQEANKMGEELTEKQFQDKAKALKEEFSTEDEYKNFLEEQKLSEKELVYLINLSEQVTKDVKPTTEEEAKEYYEQNIEQFTSPEQYQVRHILISTVEDEDGKVKHTKDEALKIAVQAVAELKNGKDFAGLAKEKSEDPGSKDNGGLYTFSSGQAAAEFEEAALALEPGEFTKEPVKTQFGYHIIKMEKVIPSEKKPFEEVKDYLKQVLTQQKQQEKFASYMDDIKKKAQITNKLSESGNNKSNNQ